MRRNFCAHAARWLIATLVVAACFDSADADVVINEVLYDSDPLNSGGEFVEVLNTGPNSVDISGWVLSDAVNYTFPPGTNLDDGDIVVVARDEIQAESYYGVEFIGQYSGALSNGGDTILLMDDGLPRQGRDVVVYEDQLPWPSEADGGGPSLELVLPSLSNTDPVNWSIGQPYSPGAANDPGVTNGGDIVITEIMYKPHRQELRETYDRVSGGSYTEEDTDEFGEYVEICNRGSTTVNLAGWRFTNGIDFTFGATSLSPGDYLLVCAEPSIMSQRLDIQNVTGPFTGTLRDGGERMTLSDDNDELVDTVAYDDVAPFPVAPDEFGHSLEVIDMDEDNGTAANWRTSVQELPPWPDSTPVVNSDWQFASVTGAATSDTLYFYVNNPGEWLVDDVRITQGVSSSLILAYYRFEEGSGTNVINSVDGGVDGQLISAGFSTDTPGTTPVIATNNFCADLRGSGFAEITARSFVFHEDGGDATLEWFMRVDSAFGHRSIWWTNADDNADDNRFNITWNPMVTDNDPQRRYVSGDFRGADGIADIGANGHNVGNPFPLNQWTHVAIVRTDLSNGQYRWEWYFDGVRSNGHTTTTNAALPTAQSWLIAGRSGSASLEAHYDEIRMTRAALAPSQFLIGIDGGLGGESHEFMPNGSFVGNDDGWDKVGNQSGSFWTKADSQDGDGGAEHLVSTGVGTGSANSIQYVGIPGVIPGELYTLSFWAKHLSGATSMTARFSGGTPETVVSAAEDVNGDGPTPPLQGFIGNGTPGALNSVTDSGLPPLVTDVTHRIEKPAGSQDVPVVARVTSETPIVSVRILYSIDNSLSVLNRQMLDDGLSSDGAAGDGVYGYVLPGQSSQTLVHYRVQATDSQGRSTTSPPDGDPSHTRAYYHYDGEINTQLTHYDLYLTDANLAVLTANPRRDDYVDASLVVNGIAYPHIGVRKRGRGTRVHPKHQWKFRFNRHELFRGDGFHDRALLGNGDRVVDCMLNQPYAQEMVYRIFDLSDAESFEHDLIRVHKNNSFFGVYVAFESPNSSWLRKHGHDPGDEVYKPRSSETPGRTLNADYYHNDIDTDLEYWGVWNKKIRSLEAPTEIRELVEALNDLSEEDTWCWLDGRVDLDQWFTRWAQYILLNIDDFTTNNHFLHLKNAELPGGGRWKWYSYDFDSGFTYNRVGSIASLYGDGRPPHANLDWQWGRFQRMVSDDPTLSRIYFLIMRDLIEETFITADIFQMMDELFTLAAPDRALDNAAWNVMRSNTSEMKNVFNGQRNSMISFLNGEGLPEHGDTPTASPPGGTFTSDVNVSLFRSNSYVPFYTLDGSDPRISKTREFYAGAIEISESSTLRTSGVRGSLSEGDWTRVNNYEFSISVSGVGPFVRGDVNNDGVPGRGLLDPITLLRFNFAGGPSPQCLAASDVNGDGDISGVSDAVWMLVYAFLGGAPPVGPFPSCATSGKEADETLGCVMSICQ